jgi:hypothetical protein
LIQKNQKSSQQKCFFGRTRPLPAAQVKPRAVKFAATSFAQSQYFRKITMPLPSLKPGLLYLLSPEAVLLTGLLNNKYFPKKEAQWAGKKVTSQVYKRRLLSRTPSQ